MDFEGIVYKKMPEVSGTSAKGTWRKQDVVFELPSEFSRKICVTFFGDKAEDAVALQEGDSVTVSVNVESREYNGKWYTDVKAWKIVRKSSSGAGSDGSRVSDAGYGHGSGAGGYASPSGGSYSSGSGFASASAQNDKAASHFSDAPFNENTAPAPADDVDDLPF